MWGNMKIALAQMNPIVGALLYNEQKIIDFGHKAFNQQANLVFFPELSLTGYPPKDLLFNRDFLDTTKEHLAKIAQKTPVPAVIGAPFEDPSRNLFNAAFLCENSKVTLIAKKVLLPNYFVFDEHRYFQSAKEGRCQSFVFQNKKFVVALCEDAWADEIGYEEDPLAKAIMHEKDIDYVVTMAASPFVRQKPALREKIFSVLAIKAQKPSLMVSQIGGMDQVVFDGSSLIFDKHGALQTRGHFAEEDLLFYEENQTSNRSLTSLTEAEQLLKILVLGIKDYVEKCRAKGVLLGLSGGMDSAVVAALSVMALGKERVKTYFLKSRYSTQSSLADAQTLALNLGVSFQTLSIDALHQDALDLLNKPTEGAALEDLDLMDQNLQSRIRMLILMGLSNSLGFLLLGTSNKSEMAVGYTTIYGDMSGALCPLGDLYKTEVVELARHLNDRQPHAMIPLEIFTKAPSAELKHHQKDEDNLPPYEVLDAILHHLIDDERFPSSFNVKGIDHTIVDKVAKMLNNSEYKRRQAPPSLLVCERGFGEARRMPIAKRIEA